MRNLFIFSSILFAVFILSLLGASIAHAQGFSGGIPVDTNSPSADSFIPPSPVQDAILRLLKPQEIFNTLQNYIKVPLPGTGVKNVEINKGNVEELNQQVSNQTGVDPIKFLRFIGGVLVMLLEGIARLIRVLLSTS